MTENSQITGNDDHRVSGFQGYAEEQMIQSQVVLRRRRPIVVIVWTVVAVVLTIGVVVGLVLST